MRSYRALTKDGKWVYGFYVKCRGDHYILPIHNLDDPESSFDERWIQEGADEDGWIEVIPETVGQSTGYKYKSLRDAYEGDIFDAYPDGSRRFLRTIIWNDEFACFQAPYSDGSGIQLFTKQQCLLYEYVGDIHTTPELMGEKGD